MKKIFLVFSFSLFTTICSQAQVYDSTVLTYADGYGKFQQLINYEISIADVTLTDSFNNKPYLFYQVSFKVDENGAIGDIWINSIYDSALSSGILSAIKKSNGHWVNHLGTELMAIVPVYYYNLYENNSFENMSLTQVYDQIDDTKSMKIFSSYYQNGNPGKTVILKAIKIITTGPTS